LSVAVINSVYADDSHIYVYTAANNATAAIACLTPCIADINDWMKASRLRLNAFKTQVMWLGTSQQLAKITLRDVPLLSTVVIVVDSVRDRSHNWQSMCMDAHVGLRNELVRSLSCGYYQLWQLRTIGLCRRGSPRH